MKTKLLSVVLLLLCYANLQAQQGEIIYYEFTDACDSSRNGYPAEGTHFDIDGDSVYDFHTTAGVYHINQAAFLGIKVDTVGWTVYPCFLYDVISHPTMLGWAAWAFTHLSESVRIDTLWNRPEGISRWNDHMYQAVDGGTDTEPNITESHLMIAIRHEISGDEEEKHYCYGWIECSMNWHWTTLPPQWTEGLLCVNRMAFCTIPNYPMRLGQTSLTDGIEDAEATAFAILHPNPTSGELTVTAEGDVQAIVIYNAMGQPVGGWNMLSMAGGRITLDVSPLPDGTYLLTVRTIDGKTRTGKFVKQ